MKSSLSMTASRWEFLVVFACTWLLTHGQSQNSDLTTGGGGKLMCNDTKALDVCWNKLPPIKDHGIPSNPQAVDNACKVFDSGMECFSNWSKNCLSKQDQDKMTSSVVGALETYRFLCTDKQFQRDFLIHADCYKRISHHWDDCARKFIDSLKRVDHARDVLSLCCIRFRYLQCVTEVASRYCSSNATRFLQKLAESLVRSTVRTYQPTQCSSVSARNCSVVSSAQSSTKFFSGSAATYSYFLYRILSYPAERLINFLNVLQNLAFTDISTFSCSVPLEPAPYFSHYPHPDIFVEEDLHSTASAPVPNSNCCYSKCNENNDNRIE